MAPSNRMLPMVVDAQHSSRSRRELRALRDVRNVLMYTVWRTQKASRSGVVEEKKGRGCTLAERKVDTEENEFKGPNGVLQGMKCVNVH